MWRMFLYRYFLLVFSFVFVSLFFLPACCSLSVSLPICRLNMSMRSYYSACSLLFSLFILKLLDFNKFASLTAIFNWQFLLAGQSKGPRTWNRPFYLWLLNEMVPVLSGWVCSHDDHMRLCSRGDTKVIQVLLISQRTKTREKKKLCKGGKKRWHTERKDNRVREWSGKERWIQGNRSRERETGERLDKEKERERELLAGLEDENRLLFFWLSGSVDWNLQRN